MGTYINNSTEKPSQYILVKKPDPIFDDINESVKDSESMTSVWQRNQEKFNRIRMRIKKDKTFPFKDASNLRMPTADIAIKKIKAGIMSAVWGTNPIVNATPSPSGNLQMANNIAKFVDHLINNVIKLKQRAEICVDQTLEKGFYFGKVYWRLEICDREEIVDTSELTPEEMQFILMAPIEQIIPIVVQRFSIDTNENVAEQNIKAVELAINEIRSGKTKVVINFKDVTYNFPDVDFISPEHVYVPTDSGFDIQKANRVTIEIFKSLDDIKYNSKFKGWDEKVVKKLSSLSTSDIDKKYIDIQKSEREGIERMNNPSNLVRVWETYGWFDIDGSGKKQKSVITSLPDFSVIVRKVKLDNFTKRFPLVKFYYDLTDDRMFSHRGVIEAMEDIIKEIDVQHNMKIDSQTLNNAPMIVYRSGMINPRTARLNPSAGIPVKGMQPLDDTIKAINFHNPNVEYSYEREQMILETKLQEYIGQVDYALQSMINKRQPRTLGEVEMQRSASGQVFSLDLTHYLDAFSELFEMIFDLWCEMGPDSYEFAYFGQMPNGERIKLNREEIQGRYTITVKGNDLVSNPQFKIQQAQQIMMAVSNPAFIQLGVIQPQHISEGLKRMYQALNIDDWELLVNQQPQPLQPQPATQITPTYSDLTHGEQAQVLQKFGLIPDIPGHVTKRHQENIMAAAEIAEKVGEDERTVGEA